MLDNSSSSSAYHVLAQAYVDDLLDVHAKRVEAGIFDNGSSAFATADGPTEKGLNKSRDEDQQYYRADQEALALDESVNQLRDQIANTV